MNKGFWVIRLLFIGLCGWMNAQEGLLQNSDVSKIMNQILNEHLGEKQVSEKVLKSALGMYIEQFDPQKYYLLQTEVDTLTNLNEEQLKKDIEKYKENDFSPFENVNQVIQKSILRAREWRKEWEANPDQLLQQAKTFKPTRSEIPEGIGGFADSLNALKQRQLDDFIEFIIVQERRFGQSAVEQKKERIMAMYERQIRLNEDRYLFQDENGKPIEAAVKEHQFVLNVLKALTKSLDAHTSFFNNTEAYDMRMRLEKGYEGIGISFGEGLDGFVIAAILPGSPADKSGLLKQGDLIVSIDGKAVNHLTLSELAELSRGEKGSLVTVVVQRPATDNSKNENITVTLTRETLSVDEERAKTRFVPFANGIIGTIRLDAFYQNDNGVSSEQDIKDAIAELKKQGNLLGLVLDLRENSGGYLMQAVKVAGLFITDGVVVISKYSDGEKVTYRDVDKKVAFDGPLVVLTSRITASAAEIVSQALQDYGVALIVGDSHTYGKGSIQSQTVTDQESSSFFKVTVGQYYTVSGKSPQKRGVIADIVVPTRFASEEIGERYLENALPSDSIDAAYQDKLDDVKPEAKSWYLKYYLPFIQTRLQQWQEYLPKLKKNSEQRIAANKNFQAFLKQIGLKPNTDSTEDVSEADEKKKKDSGHEDLQMVEAVNVVKDMVMMQADMGQSTIGSRKY